MSRASRLAAATVAAIPSPSGTARAAKSNARGCRRLVLPAVCCMLVLAAALPAAGEQPPVATIEAVDLNRYLGTWYEIARCPNRFQKKCIGFTRADYGLRPDGTIEVANQCRLAGGDTDRAIGTARQVGGATSPKLKVRFAPAWLSWLPMVWGDYWIIDLDPAYRLAAVGDPAREYLWILSRTPHVEPAAYDALLARVRVQGFDPAKLQTTPQQ